MTGVSRPCFCSPLTAAGQAGRHLVESLRGADHLHRIPAYAQTIVGAALNGLDAGA
jgi:hypothetical protein